MKIFISSLISGMEAERAAVQRAIKALRHEPVMAEAFGAKPMSPQIACLQGVREADLVISLFGSRYGALQASGLSATHEEFREAAGQKSILMFVQDGMSPEGPQQAFIDEASGWHDGLFRAGCSSPDTLMDAVSGAIHQWDLSQAAAPLDLPDLRSRLLALLHAPPSNTSQSGTMLTLVLVGGPHRAILRPVQLEAPALREAIQREGIFGSHRIFDKSGVTEELKGSELIVRQPGPHNQDCAVFSLCEDGAMQVHLRVDPPAGRMGLPAVIEEDVTAQLRNALAFVAWALDHIDPTLKLSTISLAARLVGSGEWRTRAEHAASPNSMSSMGFGKEQQRGKPVMLTPEHRSRAELKMQMAHLVEDLVVLLRRQWKQ